MVFFCIHWGNFLMLWFSKVADIVQSHVCDVSVIMLAMSFTILSRSDCLFKSGSAYNATKWSNYFAFKPLLHWSRNTIQTLHSEEIRRKFSYHSLQPYTKSTVFCDFPPLVRNVGEKWSLKETSPVYTVSRIFWAVPLAPREHKLFSLTAKEGLFWIILVSQSLSLSFLTEQTCFIDRVQVSWNSGRSSPIFKYLK